ncbi:hypothetical protein [Acinetobacter sp. TSRC1-2]|uniref:hypothetical protein n=1 Tax=unclassified Acinetobacter TaxID=196816 RepID=UPI003CE7DD0B
MNNSSEDKRFRKVCYVATGIWIVFFFTIYILGWLERPTTFNELGDFLAGIFAPVAFFWLILGYVQQGKQLDQNSVAINQQAKALNLQIEEMKVSTQIQQNFASIQMEQLQALYLSAKPDIEIVSGSWECASNLESEEETSAYKLHLIIINYGLGQAKGIKFYYHDGDQIDLPLDNSKYIENKIIKLDKNREEKIELFIDQSVVKIIEDEGTKSFNLKLKYQDMYKQPYEVGFLIYFVGSDMNLKSGDIIYHKD